MVKKCHGGEEDMCLAWGWRGSSREAISMDRFSHQQPGRSPQPPIPTRSPFSVLLLVHTHMTYTWHKGVSPCCLVCV